MICMPTGIKAFSRLFARGCATVLPGLFATLVSNPTLASECKTVGENLVLDTAFASFDAPYSQRKWHSSEHTTKRSFTYTVEDGVLTIEQVATEPWAVVSQTVDARGLAGKSVKYSAQIKLDLTPAPRSANLKNGGGLLLWAKKGSRLLLDSTMEHEPYMGTSDWVDVEVVKKIPKGVTFVELGFIHQAGGKIAVRKPSLFLLDASAGGCVE